MAALRTRLTSLLGIRTPLVSAPMAVQGSLDRVALAVNKAGGFGFVALGYEGASNLQSTLRSIRSELQVPASQPLPIGAGFIGWVVEESKEDILSVILPEHPKAVWFAFGRDMGKLVKKVHDYNQANGTNILVFLQATSMEEALQAANEWKVDVLVVQGCEAGGHCSATIPSLSVFLTSVLQTLPADNRPIIIGAGGIHTGSQFASVLTLGAAGAVVGTRLLFTPEINYSAAKTKALQEAGIKSTVVSTVFDEVRGTTGWPTDIQGRALNNDIVRDLEEGLSLEERKVRFSSGKGDRAVVMAGMGVGLTKDMKGTADVITELHEDAVKALREAVQIVN